MSTYYFPWDTSPYRPSVPRAGLGWLASSRHGAGLLSLGTQAPAGRWERENGTGKLASIKSAPAWPTYVSVWPSGVVLVCSSARLMDALLLLFFSSPAGSLAPIPWDPTRALSRVCPPARPPARSLALSRFSLPLFLSLSSLLCVCVCPFVRRSPARERAQRATYRDLVGEVRADWQNWMEKTKKPGPRKSGRGLDKDSIGDSASRFANPAAT